MKTTFKTESVEEYLIRGGKITVCTTNELSSNIRYVNITINGPATILSYEEADLLYGEAKPVKKEKSTAKPKIKVDINLLPEALRVKFLAKLQKGSTDE